MRPPRLKDPRRWDDQPVGDLWFWMADRRTYEDGLSLEGAVMLFARLAFPPGPDIVQAVVADELGVIHLGYHYETPLTPIEWTGTAAGHTEFQRLTFLDPLEVATAEIGAKHLLEHPTAYR